MKQDINNFLAFRALYDMDLLDAIESGDLKEIEKVIKSKYAYELKNDFFNQSKINIEKICREYKELTNELDNNPSLIK